MSRQLKYINGLWCVIDSETGEETGKKSIPKDVTTRIEQEEEPEPYCYRTYLDHLVFELEDRPVYPYRIVHQLGLRTLDFAPVTILYGGNGSGKSTLLNIIAENTGISRRTQGNTNEYFSSYVSKCAHETAPFLYCIVEHMDQACEIGLSLVESLGLKRYIIPLEFETEDFHEYINRYNNKK